MTNNILVHGDSIFRGVTFDDQKHKYIYAQNRIENQLAPKINATIINKSKFGNTITKSAESLSHNLEKYQPEFVVIELGGNDCDYDWKAVADSPTQAHICNTDFPAFKNSVREMIHTIKAHGARPILTTLPPLDAERFFKWILKQNNVKGENVLAFIGNVTHIYWWQERYNAAILNIAKQENCPIIDLRTAFLQTEDFTQYLCIDGMHPNPQGQDLMSNVILDFIHQQANYLLI
jgi:lysophospholipase L1-like esterase